MERRKKHICDEYYKYIENNRNDIVKSVLLQSNLTFCINVFSVAHRQPILRPSLGRCEDVFFFWMNSSF